MTDHRSTSKSKMFLDYIEPYKQIFKNDLGDDQPIPIFTRLSRNDPLLSREFCNAKLHSLGDHRSTIKNEIDLNPSLRDFEENFGPSKILLETNDDHFLDMIFGPKWNQELRAWVREHRKRALPVGLQVVIDDNGDPDRPVTLNPNLRPDKPTYNVKFSRSGIPLFHRDKFKEYIPVARKDDGESYALVQRTIQSFYLRWNHARYQMRTGPTYFDPDANLFVSTNGNFLVDLLKEKGLIQSDTYLIDQPCQMDLEFDSIAFDKVTNHWIPKPEFFLEPADTAEQLSDDIAARVRSLLVPYYWYQEDLPYVYELVTPDHADLKYFDMIITTNVEQLWQSHEWPSFEGKSLNSLIPEIRAMVAFPTPAQRFHCIGYLVLQMSLLHHLKTVSERNDRHRQNIRIKAIRYELYAQFLTCRSALIQEVTEIELATYLNQVADTGAWAQHTLKAAMHSVLHNQILMSAWTEGTAQLIPFTPNATRLSELQWLGNREMTAHTIRNIYQCAFAKLVTYSASVAAMLAEKSVVGDKAMDHVSTMARFLAHDVYATGDLQTLCFDAIIALTRNEDLTDLRYRTAAQCLNNGQFSQLIVRTMPVYTAHYVYSNIENIRLNGGSLIQDTNYVERWESMFKDSASCEGLRLLQCLNKRLESFMFQRNYLYERASDIGHKTLLAYWETPEQTALTIKIAYVERRNTPIICLPLEEGTIMDNYDLNNMTALPLILTQEANEAFMRSQYNHSALPENRPRAIEIINNVLWRVKTLSQRMSTELDSTDYRLAELTGSVIAMFETNRAKTHGIIIGTVLPYLRVCRYSNSFAFMGLAHTSGLPPNSAIAAVQHAVKEDYFDNFLEHNPRSTLRQPNTVDWLAPLEVERRTRARIMSDGKRTGQSGKGSNTPAEGKPPEKESKKERKTNTNANAQNPSPNTTTPSTSNTRVSQTRPAQAPQAPAAAAQSATAQAGSSMSNTNAKTADTANQSGNTTQQSQTVKRPAPAAQAQPAQQQLAASTNAPTTPAQAGGPSTAPQELIVETTPVEDNSPFPTNEPSAMILENQQNDDEAEGDVEDNNSEHSEDSNLDMNPADLVHKVDPVIGTTINWAKSGLMGLVEHTIATTPNREDDKSIVNLEHLLDCVDPCDANNGYSFSQYYHYNDDSKKEERLVLTKMMEAKMWDMSAEPRKKTFPPKGTPPVFLKGKQGEWRKAVKDANANKTKIPTLNLLIERTAQQGFDAPGVWGDRLYLDERGDWAQNNNVFHTNMFLSQYDYRDEYLAYFKQNSFTTTPMRTPWIELGFYLNEEHDDRHYNEDPFLTEEVSSMELYASNLRIRHQAFDANDKPVKVDVPLHGGMSFVHSWMYMRLFPAFHIIKPEAFTPIMLDNNDISSRRFDILLTEEDRDSFEFLLENTRKALQAFQRCWEIIGLDVDDATAYKATRLGRFWFNTLWMNTEWMIEIIEANYIPPVTRNETKAVRCRSAKRIFGYRLPDALVCESDDSLRDKPDVNSFILTHSLDPTQIPLVRNGAPTTRRMRRMNGEWSDCRMQNRCAYSIVGHQRTPFNMAGELLRDQAKVDSKTNEFCSFTPWTQYVTDMSGLVNYDRLKAVTATLLQRNLGDSTAASNSPLVNLNDSSTGKMVCMLCQGPYSRDRSIVMQIQETHGPFCPETFPWNDIPAQKYVYLCKKTDFFHRHWSEVTGHKPDEEKDEAEVLQNIEYYDLTANERKKFDDYKLKFPEWNTTQILDVLETAINRKPNLLPASKRGPGDNVAWSRPCEYSDFRPHYNCVLPYVAPEDKRINMPDIIQPFAKAYASKLVGNQNYEKTLKTQYNRIGWNRFCFAVETGIASKRVFSLRDQFCSAKPTVKVARTMVNVLQYYGDNASLSPEVKNLDTEVYNSETFTLSEMLAKWYRTYNEIMLRGNAPAQRQTSRPKHGPMQYRYLEDSRYPKQKANGVAQPFERNVYIPSIAIPEHGIANFPCLYIDYSLRQHPIGFQPNQFEPPNRIPEYSSDGEAAHIVYFKESFSTTPIDLPLNRKATETADQTQKAQPTASNASVQQSASGGAPAKLSQKVVPMKRQRQPQVQRIRAEDFPQLETTVAQHLAEEDAQSYRDFMVSSDEELQILEPTSSTSWHDSQNHTSHAGAVVANFARDDRGNFVMSPAHFQQMLQQAQQDAQRPMAEPFGHSMAHQPGTSAIIDQARFAFSEALTRAQQPFQRAIPNYAQAASAAPRGCTPIAQQSGQQPQQSVQGYNLSGQLAEQQQFHQSWSAPRPPTPSWQQPQPRQSFEQSGSFKQSGQSQQQRFPLQRRLQAPQGPQQPVASRSCLDTRVIRPQGNQQSVKGSTSSASNTPVQPNSVNTQYVHPPKCDCRDVIDCPICKARHDIYQEFERAKWEAHKYEWESGLWKRYYTEKNLPDRISFADMKTNQDFVKWCRLQGDNKWHRLTDNRNAKIKIARTHGPKITAEEVQRVQANKLRHGGNVQL